MIDSHCHLDDEQFDGDREAVIERALEAGVTQLVSIGTGAGLPDLEAGIRMAERRDFVHATVGIHPQYAGSAADTDLARLPALLKHPKVVACGEIGLDYHWQPFSPERQRDVFVAQMDIARAAAMPVVIHTRDAWTDTLALLREHWAPSGLPCVMHCFTGGPEQAREALELGFYLSFSGVVTYPKAAGVHESARIAPIERLLIETDAPYLAPAPHRGKRNEPAYLARTAARIAELRGVDPVSLCRETGANALRIFAKAIRV